MAGIAVHRHGQHVRQRDQRTGTIDIVGVPTVAGVGMQKEKAMNYLVIGFVLGFIIGGAVMCGLLWDAELPPEDKE